MTQDHADERARFGALRELLQRAPSAELWQELLALWRTWPVTAATYQEALPYAHAHLERWPKALDAHRHWDPLWMRGPRPSPWASLARTFEYDPKQMSAFLSTGLAPLLLYAPTLKHLDISQMSPPTDDLKTLLRLAGPGLESLRARSLGMRVEELLDALMGSAMGALKSLDLSGVALQEPDLDRLLQTPWFGQLETLELVGCDSLSEAGLLKLWGMPWEKLRRLELDFAGISDGLVEALCHRAPFKALKRLSMSLEAPWYGGQPSLASLERLWGARALASVEDLNMGCFSIDAAELSVLMRPSALSELKALELHIDGWFDERSFISLAQQVPADHPQRAVLLQTFLRMSKQGSLSRDHQEELELLDALTAQPPVTEDD